VLECAACASYCSLYYYRALLSLWILWDLIVALFLVWTTKWPCGLLTNTFLNHPNRHIKSSQSTQESPCWYHHPASCPSSNTPHSPLPPTANSAVQLGNPALPRSRACAPALLRGGHIRDRNKDNSRERHTSQIMLVVVTTDLRVHCLCSKKHILLQNPLPWYQTIPTSFTSRDRSLVT